MKTRYLPIALAVPLCLFLFIYKLHRDKVKTAPPPKIVFINGSTNNKLEVLDFGGDGRNILFLAGLGNTAHVFDDFAPNLPMLSMCMRLPAGALAHLRKRQVVTTLPH